MIAFIIKATISLAICFAFYRFFLVKESMFRFNRFYLIFAICFSLIVPFLQMPFDMPIKESLFPEKTLMLSEEKSENKAKTLSAEIIVSEHLEKADSEPIQVNDTFNWFKFFLAIYLFGLTFFLLRFIVQLRQLISLIRKNPNIREKDCTYILLEQKTLPFTFLNFLFLEKEAYQNKCIEEEILFHELAHIRQKHTWDILLVELMKIVFWFNPLYFLYKNAIQLNHEFLADAAVNSRFQNKTAYQWLLFNKVAGQEVDLSISSPFNFSSTKNRLIMMGKSSSRFKTKLLKSISAVLAGFLLISLSASQSFEAVPFGVPNDYEQILAKAFQEDNPFYLNLNQLDLTSLRKAYLALDEDEKYKVTEFPFFDDLTFEKLVELQKAYPKVRTSILYETPPEKKIIKQEVYDEWKKTKKITLTIDDQEKDIEALNNYQPEDFAIFVVRETEKKGFFKKPAYSVSLMTHEYYHGKYYQSQKKIRLIQAEYPNEDKVQVNYWIKHFAMKNGQITKFIPGNYEASIFHHFKTIDTTQLDSEKSNGINYISKENISIIIISAEDGTITSMQLPSI